MNDESPIRDAKPAAKTPLSKTIPLATSEVMHDGFHLVQPAHLIPPSEETRPASRAAYMRAWRAAKQAPNPDMPLKSVAGAVSAIAAALEPLDPESRQRALDAVCAILG